MKDLCQMGMEMQNGASLSDASNVQFYDGDEYFGICIFDSLELLTIEAVGLEDLEKYEKAELKKIKREYSRARNIATIRRLNNIKTAELSDYYVKKCILQGYSNFKREDIPDKLVRLKRAQLRLKREIRKLK